MGLTAFPNGISSFGMPVMGIGDLDLNTTGNVFFVDSGNTANGGDTRDKGKSPDKPFLTIDYAIGQCAASNGDIIFVMPGHVENIVTATSFVSDVVGVRIIGLGVGESKPVLTYTATAGSIEMDAASCTLANMILVASVSAVVVGINVNADDVTLANLTMRIDATGDDFITMIDVDAFDRCHILNCNFLAEEGAAGCNEAIRLDDTHHTVISHSHFSGDFTDACIIGEGALGNGLLIDNCYLYNADTTAGLLIDLNVAFTGLIANCRGMGLIASAVANTIDPGSCGVVDTVFSNAIDESGIPPLTLAT
jgi:hypothetical protein